MIIKAFEFDDHPGSKPQVILRETEDYQHEIVFKSGDAEVLLISTTRDQWGTFIHLPGRTVAQEDDTRSFLDAFAKAIAELRRRVELSTEATELEVNRTDG